MPLRRSARIGTPLTIVRLLAKLRWQPDPHRWTVPVRGPHGQRARLRVYLAEEGVTLHATTPGPWTISALGAGHLRGVIRDALATLDRLDHADPPPEPRASALPEPASVGRSRRQSVDLTPPVRPSVYEIAERVIRTAPPQAVEARNRPDAGADFSTWSGGRAA